MTTLAALHSLRSVAAAATFYNSVSSVFEIEATVRTGQEDGGAKGGREGGAEGEEGAGEKYFYSNSMPMREGSQIRLRMEFGGVG